MRDFAADPHLVVIRSFNINNPGDHKHPEKDDVVKSLKGGIAGGSITKGVLRVGDVVEIRPGLVEWDENMQVKVRPLKTRVESLHSESKKLQFAVPGGLIGVGTRLDPYLCRQDRLVGNVIGKPGCMPKVFVELTVSYTLLHRLLGTAGKEGAKVSKLRINDTLQINVGASAVLAVVTGLKDNLAKFRPNKPVCADIGESIAISRKVDGFRLIGWAKIVKGKALALDDN
ncbi:eukaryotic translation initiation factor 2 subunit gamma [Coemansia sp. RSA 2618]|nr:eukaryotic translation initiation factor 2 subunit gamma [Coemansia sp. RSA 2618]